MEPNDLAHLLGTTSNTIRRWTAEFYKYLSPSAAPPKGRPRVYGEHDQRVLHFVAACRDSKLSLETITARLEAMRGQDWQGLPDIPPEWRDQGEMIAVSVAAGKAYDLAQMAVIQRELEHTQQALQQALERADGLQTALDSARLEISTSADQIHALEIDLAQARGEVAELRARLGAYAITGSTPIPVLLIAALVAVAVAALVIALLIVVRLVL